MARMVSGSHELILAVSEADGSCRRDLKVQFGEGTTVAELGLLLGNEEGSMQAPSLFVGTRRLDPAATLLASGLHHGDLVCIGKPVPDRASKRLELTVIGGPSAGLAVPLNEGRVVVGRGSTAQLRLDDDELSRAHLALHVTEIAVDVEDLGSTNGTWIGGRRIDERSAVTIGHPVEAGQSVIVVREASRPDGDLSSGSAPGTAVFNRPPRIQQAAPTSDLTVPTRPEAKRSARIPLAAIVIPLLVAGGMSYARGNPMFLALALASPLMLAVNAVSDQRSGARHYRAELADYERRSAEVAGLIQDAVRADEVARRDASPDPATVQSIATGPGRRLWERQPSSDDFLELRLGLTSLDARVQLTSARGDAPPPPQAGLVPATVPMLQAGVLGLAGPDAVVVPLIRAALAQAAVLHSPRDLVVVLCAPAARTEIWEWMKWLPHSRPPSPDLDCERMVGFGPEQVERRIAELGRLLDQRLEERREHRGEGRVGHPAVLVVLDGARWLRSVTELDAVLTDGPAVGIHAVCLEHDETALPKECRAVAVVEDGHRLRLELPGPLRLPDVLGDGISGEVADVIGRALAPLRDPGRAAGGAVLLPNTVRFLELEGLPELGADDVLAGWQTADRERSTRALLGVAETGPLTIDLRGDGPHGLVAGTTGAGKSELLQTLVVSLALRNRPDALHFVLVDYKGGSAFKDCVRLPHAVGMVTDLDGHLVERALTSLSAELKRREAAFAAVGAKDLEEHWSSARGSGEPIARLVLVIDEFASLAEEVPDFVRGLVGIAMRGRSLGVHMILGTQRPAGVVSPEIRTNVNLRLCLRVNSTADSQDVIDAPDAARISRATPGRAFLRTGHGELVAFQTARVSWPRRAAGHPVPIQAVPYQLAGLGGQMAQANPVAADDAPTDLWVTIDAVAEASRRLGCPPPPSPWLPPLPRAVTLDDLERLQAPSALPAFPIGLLDLPSEQAQRPLTVDFDRTGHLVVVGGVRSGRSTVLRILAGAVARRASVADVHLYGLDFGNRALAPLEALPHCGAVVGGDEQERLARFLSFLEGEIGRRQDALAAAGSSSLTEYRAGRQDAPPYLLVLLDKFESFLTAYSDLDAGRWLETLYRLLREGPGVGVFFVITTDRGGLVSRLSSVTDARLVLRLADRDAYSAVGISPRAVPTVMPNGRGIWGPDQLEVQVALLTDDPNGPAQTEALLALGRGAAEREQGLPRSIRPRRVDDLPRTVTLAEADLLRVAVKPTGPGAITLGVGGDEILPVDLDLDDLGGTFVVAGPPRSGRSTALLAIATGLSAAGEKRLLAVVAARPSPLRGLEGRPGVAAVVTAVDQVSATLRRLVAAGQPLAVVVDDAELLLDPPAAIELERLVRTARDAGHLVVAAGSTDDLASNYRGWVAEARRNRCGLLLAPQAASEGELFRCKLPRSTGGPAPAGRGLLVLHGKPQPMQVAVSG